MGPAEVTARLGGPLAVSCGYKPGYELYPKYWCRPGFLWLCFSDVIQTNGSEETVTQGRVSIRDDHVAHSFTVTLGGVTPEDAGWYSCGLKRRLWFNLKYTTKVMVSAGKFGLGSQQGCLVEPVTWVPALRTGPPQPGEHRGLSKQE